MIFLALYLYKSFSYNPSLFAPSSHDYVVTLDADSFYFIENIPTPSKAKHIKEAHFSSTTIPDDSYGWPGHDRVIDQATEDEEGQNMYNFYKNRVNLTQNDMYYHPRAPEQSWSTWEVVDSLQRAKVKVTLDPIHRSFRTTNLYMPPGELITFDILPESVGKVKVYIEAHRQPASINQRIKFLQCETVLTAVKSTWGYPTGGAVTFELIDLSANSAIEINVTGCVVAQHFVYGVTDERDWEESIRHLEAPSCQITNGAINQFTYSTLAHDIDRMDDAQAWWRSAYMRSQELAPDPCGENDRYTINYPLNMRYDNYVGCGVACAWAGSQFIDFDTSWFNSANKINNLIGGNPWGSVHEMNHHHQSNWAFTDMAPATSEATNNVLNTYIYTFQNCASGERKVDGDLNPITLVDHLETIHPFYLVDWEFMEAEWDLIFHCLGYDVFKKYMDMSTTDSPYSWRDYNGYGKHVLALMEATGYDVYEYCNYYCEHTDRKPMIELLQWGGDTTKYENFMKTYKSHPAYGKLFHPMGCFYACGYIRNNQRFETVRPFKINAYINTTFDFNKALKQRSGDKKLWGDFVFDKIVSKRQDAWTETSKGVFEYQPVDDLSFIDEAHAYYIDQTTGEEVICIVRLELRPINTVHEVKYYQFKPDVCTRHMSIYDCYKNLDKHTLWKTVKTGYKGIPWIKERNLTAVTDMTFTPSETGDYIFGATISERGFVYLSEEPLTGNYDTDEKHRIVTKTYWFDANNGDVNGGKSEKIHLEKGKKMYLRLVVNNAHDPEVCTETNHLCRDQTGETVYVNKNGYFGDNDVLPDDWFKVQEPLQFIPSFVDFKYGDLYKGDKIVKNAPTKWTASVSMAIKSVYTLTNTDIDWSQGKECTDCNDEDVSRTILDWDPTTEVRSGWWPPDEKGQPFPHKWDVNFNGEESFDTIYLKGAFNQNYFPMESDISIYLNTKDGSSEGIETDDNLIWQGLYESKKDELIKLSKKYNGKYLRIVVHDNKINWKDGNPGRSTFAYITVGSSLCVTNYKVPRECNWEVRKDGYYINGRCYVGKKGDTYSYIPDEGINQVAIVGDRFYGMGTAKVYVDDVLVKTISESDIDMIDLKAFKYASRSYRRILYATPVFNNRPTIRIDVESGEFRITGFIVGSTDEDTIINNGPMPTQTPTLYPMPTKDPIEGPSDEDQKPEEVSSEEDNKPVEISSENDQKPIEVSSEENNKPIEVSSEENNKPIEVSSEENNKPIEVSSENDQKPVEVSSVNDNKPIESTSENDHKPVVTSTDEKTVAPTEQTPVVPGPSIDSSFEATGGRIEFTENGFKDGEEEKDTSSIDKDIIIIKGDSDKITLVPGNTDKGSTQDKYVSITKPNAEVTIELPPSGDYGKSELGIHANSNSPTVSMPASSVPLNIYNDADSSISLKLTGDASSSKTVAILKVTSTKGSLSLKVEEGVESVEAREVNFYNEGRIEAVQKSGKPIDTIIGQLNLKDDSKSTVSNVNIKNGLKASANTRLDVKGKATFNEKSVISLTVTSFIEFGNSVIQGICEKLSLASSAPSSAAARTLQEATLMCGASFDCDQWKTKFEGSTEYPAAKCVKNEASENCLVAFDGKEEGGNGGGGKKLGAGAIAGIVVAVVAVIVAVVVGVVIYMKKKNRITSSDIQLEL